MAETIVHIVTDGFDTPNARAFLYPLRRFSACLREMGISLRCFRRGTAGAAECDILLLDSKCFRQGWGERTDDTLAEFAGYRRGCRRLIFCDNSDSSGFLVGAALAASDRYLKLSVLRDRSLYTRPMYGRRLYTAYYHRSVGVEERRSADRAAGAARMLPWSGSGFPGTPAFATTPFRPLSHRLRGRLPFDWLLRPPGPFHPPRRTARSPWVPHGDRL
jgi:hypothetical protein